ncbi:MAG TPA: hypothetical protein VMO52_09335 [Acidimicrobiia bacterium]|nr:hypothetical protein [Acidimicrobiia bacterium]
MDEKARSGSRSTATDTTPSRTAHLATLALSSGKIHPKVVQERLGHSSISITLDRYSHVVEGMDREAAEIVARMIKGSG